MTRCQTLLLLMWGSVSLVSAAPPALKAPGLTSLTNLDISFNSIVQCAS